MLGFKDNQAINHVESYERDMATWPDVFLSEAKFGGKNCLDPVKSVPLLGEIIVLA